MANGAELEQKEREEARWRILRVLDAGRPVCFFFNDTAPTELYTLSLHDALPISPSMPAPNGISDCSIDVGITTSKPATLARSEEHTSELQSLAYLVCRLLLEKKNSARNPARLLNTTIYWFQAS